MYALLSSDLIQGRYVYLSGSTDDETLLFSWLLEASGKLRALPGSPMAFESTRGLAFDPGGDYLYVADGGTVVGYAVERDTGTVAPLGSVTALAGTAIRLVVVSP